MSDVVRFTVSVESDLLEDFDSYCKEEHLATRSEAVRKMIRDTLTRKAWASDDVEVAGTLTVVYDHHRPQLSERFTEIQHQHNELIISTLHAHLSHDICLEVIILRGPAGQLRDLASKLKGLKGIFKGELVMASHGDTDRDDHAHDHTH